MRLICSVIFLSIWAMIASIDLTTSLLINFVCASACSASVRTARSTASLASSVFGLNSFFRRKSNSLASRVPVADCGSCWDFCSAITVLRSVRQRLRRRFILRLLRGRQRLQEGRILQQLAHQILGPALAVHVRDQIREL